MPSLTTQLCKDSYFKLPIESPTEKGFRFDMNAWDDYVRWDDNSEGSPFVNCKSSFVSNYLGTDEHPWIDGSVKQERANKVLLDDAPFGMGDFCTPQSTVPELDSWSATMSTGENDIREPYCCYSSLTIAEETELRNIAMPYQNLAKPALENVESSYSPEPETQSTKSKKLSEEWAQCNREAIPQKPERQDRRFATSNTNSKKKARA